MVPQLSNIAYWLLQQSETDLLDQYNCKGNIQFHDKELISALIEPSIDNPDMNVWKMLQCSAACERLVKYIMPRIPELRSFQSLLCEKYAGLVNDLITSGVNITDDEVSFLLNSNALEI